MSTEFEPLLLLTVLLVLLPRMRPPIHQVLDSPLLCHDCPTTNLLKKGPGLYQLHVHVHVPKAALRDHREHEPSS